MNAPDSPSPSLRERADQLAAEGSWHRLGELLGESMPLDADDSALAYRYGEALYHTGRMAELAEFARAQERSTRQAADPPGTMRALNLAGIAAFELGNISSARRAFDSLMDLAEAEQDDDMLARAANNLGAVANLRGRRHEALAYYQIAIPLYHKLDQVRGLAQTHHNLGLTYQDLGLPREAIDAFRQAEDIASSIPYAALVAMSTVGRAEAELRRGDVQLASALSERGLAMAAAGDDPISEAEAHRVYGLALAATGATGDAAGMLETGLGLAEEAGNRLVAAKIERDLGRTLQALGRAEEGRVRLLSALTAFETLGAQADARELASELSEDG